MRPRLAAWAVAVSTVLVVALSVTSPDSAWADAGRANLLVQTTAALVALLVAAIAYGRFRLRRRLADLLLVLALGQFAVGNLLFTTMPLVADGTAGSRSAWAATLTRLAGVVLLCAAAFAGGRAVDRPRRTGDATGVALATVTLTGLALVLARSLPEIDPGSPGERLWATAPGLSAAHVLTAALAALAAAGFLRAYGRDPGDGLLAWLAVASCAAAGGYAVTAGTFVSSYSTYVTNAELLRLGSCLLLLGGVLRELRGYWHATAAAAVAEERRRIARDLHDGLAQELAFIVTRSRVLARRTDDVDLWWICSAAERALDESRRAIETLTRDDDEPLDLALAHAAAEVGARLGTNVTLELEDIDVSGDCREALVRIAREAIANAVRHGAATRVHIRLSVRDGVCLRVTDNGIGFDADAQPPPGCLGLTGIRERVAALGGAVTVSSQARGTAVEVVLP